MRNPPKSRWRSAVSSAVAAQAARAVPTSPERTAGRRTLRSTNPFFTWAGRAMAAVGRK